MMKIGLKVRTNASSVLARFVIMILSIIAYIALNFLLYFLLSALGIWAASLCFGFAFKWIYAAGAGIMLMILSIFFSG